MDKNKDLSCPLCGAGCTVLNGMAYCGDHFTLVANGTPLEIFLRQLAYCWEDIALEELDGKVNIVRNSLTYICQEKDGCTLEAEGKLKNIIGLFGAFKKITSGECVG